MKVIVMAKMTTPIYEAHCHLCRTVFRHGEMGTVDYPHAPLMIGTPYGSNMAPAIRCPSCKNVVASGLVPVAWDPPLIWEPTPS